MTSYRFQCEYIEYKSLKESAKHLKYLFIAIIVYIRLKILSETRGKIDLDKDCPWE